jgi:hypothetical protein
VDKLLFSAGDPKSMSIKQRKDVISALSTKSELRLDHKHRNFSWWKSSCLLGLSGHRYKPVSVYDAFDSLPSNTSSSFPDFKSPKTGVRTKIISQILRLNSKNIFYLLNYYININWRTQVSSSKKLKFRQFYPFPVVVATLERMLFGNIFKHFELNKKTPYAYANIYPDLKERYNTWQSHPYIYSLDLASYDIRIAHLLITEGIDFLATHISLGTKEKVILNFLKEYHTQCLLLSSIDGKPFLFKKERGLMSGSALTNLLGSLINLFMLLYINKKYDLRVSFKSISIMGDDIIFATDRHISLEKISHLYRKHFDAIIHLEKSEVFSPGQKVFFLGYYFDNNGRYIDAEKTKLQLCISGSYVSEEDISTRDRIWSKFCSTIFRCSDGSLFFEEHYRKLLHTLELEKPIGYFYELFQGKLDKSRIRDFNYYKVSGWLLS